MYDKYSKRSRRFAFVTMKTVEDANAAAEKLNGTVSFIAEFTKYIKRLLMFIQQFRFLKGLTNFVFILWKQIGGREIKVNITEKPLTTGGLPVQAEESTFVDSPYKIYVGNLAKKVTSDSLKNFFSEKANALSAKVSRVPGTSKSSGFGFVTFSSDEDVEAAISSFNNAVSFSLPFLFILHAKTSWYTWSTRHR